MHDRKNRDDVVVSTTWTRGPQNNSRTTSISSSPSVAVDKVEGVEMEMEVGGDEHAAAPRHRREEGASWPSAVDCRRFPPPYHPTVSSVQRRRATRHPAARRRSLLVLAAAPFRIELAPPFFRYDRIPRIHGGRRPLRICEVKLGLSRRRCTERVHPLVVVYAREALD